MMPTCSWQKHLAAKGSSMYFKVVETMAVRVVATMVAEAVV